MQEETVFHKIVSGEIPNHTVYEDEHALAFLDIHPIAKGHTVVILKKGNPSVLDYTSEDLERLMRASQEAMRRIKSVLAPESFNLGINDGPVAGQAVPYLHMHIIPRWDGDGGGSLHSIVQNPGDQSVEEIAEKFR